MKALKFAIMGLLGVAFATTVACASGPAPDPVPRSAQATAKASGPIDIEEGYRLGAGDKVKITVFNEPTLTGDVIVDGQGNISMPLIGEVVVKNLTVRELERLIASKLKDGWVRDPQVSAEMTSYRPYYILGEITKPGEYPFISGLTVMKAVASAGDFTYRADKKKVFIKSMDSPNEREVRLTPSTLVKPGDTIRIRERFF